MGKLSGFSGASITSQDTELKEVWVREGRRGEFYKVILDYFNDILLVVIDGELVRGEWVCIICTFHFRKE